MKNYIYLFTTFYILFVSTQSIGQVSDTTLARIYVDSAEVLIKNKQLDKALDFGEQALEIYKSELEEDTLIANVYFMIGNIYRKKKDYDQALKFYNKTLDIKKNILGEEHNEVGMGYHSIGVIYHLNKKYTKALEFYQLALKVYNKRPIPNGVTLSRTYFNMGLIFKVRAKYDIALDNYKKGLDLQINTIGEINPDVASSYNNIGTIYYLKDNYKEAIKNYKKATEIKIEVFGEKNESTIRSYTNIGAMYFKLSKNKKALTYYEKALEVQLKTQDKNHPNIISSYLNMGAIYQSNGDLEKALNYYFRALQGNYASEHPSIETEIHLFNNIGLNNSKTGNYKEAFSYFNKALQLSKQEYGETHPKVAVCHNFFGKINYDKHDYNTALINYKTALSINQKATDKPNIQFAKNYINIGLCYKKLGKFDKATEYYQKSLDIKLKFLDSKNPELAVSYQNMGSLNKSLQNPEKEIFYLQKAFNIWNTIYSSPHFKIAQNLNSQGEHYWGEQNFDKANKCFSEAIENLEGSIKTLTSESSQQYHQEENHHLFDNIISFNYDAHKNFPEKYNLAQCFNYSERVKSNQLLQALNTSEANNFSGIPDSLLEKEYDIRTDILYYEKQKQEKLAKGLSPTDSLTLVLSSQLFDLKNKYENLIQQLEKEYPKYYRTKYDYSTLRVKDIQESILTKDKSLLEYFVGDSSIYIFLIKKDDFKVHKIERDFPLEEWVNNLTKNGIHGFYTLPQEKRLNENLNLTINNYTNAALALYEKLIKPVAESLTEEVIIIPDGLLGYIPFEALIDSAPKRVGIFKTYPFLLYKYQISYCYSATLLNEMKQIKHQEVPPYKLLAMAPFFQDDVNKLIAQIDGSDFLALRDSLTSLPASGEEVASIGKIMKGHTTYGQFATIEEFKKVANQYRILHLSTHGKADDKIGNNAFLAFSKPEKKGMYDKLYTLDLYNYELNTDMVVLSACETGIGELQKGEGIISLARAFAYAGSKSVFTTLWQVSDQKTKELMIYFYKNIKDGQRKDLALRNAKRSFLKNNSKQMHPFFWAGMIGIGDMNPLD